MPRRLAWPVLFTLLLAAPTIAALVSPVPDAVESDFVPDLWDLPSRAIDFRTEAGPDGINVAHLTLWQPVPERLLFRQQVRFLFATYDTHPGLVRAELGIDGTECAYRAARSAVLVDNQYLDLFSGPGCQVLRTPPTGRLNLVVAFRGNARIGLWTSTLPFEGAVAQDSIYSRAEGHGADRRVSVVRGRYVDYRSQQTWRRFALLNYVWHLSASSLWLWAIAGSSFLLVFVGALLVTPRHERSLSPIQAATATALVALGITLLYVIVVPPFEAPDEPDHLLSFAQVAGHEQLADDAADLAELGHVARIRFHSEDRFRPADIGHPLQTPWDVTVFPERVAARSITTHVWWMALSPFFRELDASSTLLAIRLANALVFAVLLGIGSALMMIVSRDAVPAPESMGLVLLWIPTLPFFAMHMSEFALLTSLYAFLTLIIVGIFLDGPRTYLLGLPLGLGVSLVLASGRSSLPFLGVVMATLAGRAILGNRSNDLTTDRRRAFVFWTGAAAGLLALSFMVTPEFRSGLWPVDAGDITEVPRAGRMAAEMIRHSPWLLVLLGPLGFAAETALARFRSGPAQGTSRSLRYLACIVSVLVGASFIGSMVLSYPDLSTIESRPPASAGSYIRQVLSVAATSFRLKHHDLLLSHSFWGGFGWVDTLPAESFISGLVVLAAAGLVGLLLFLARGADRRRWMWLGIFSLGWTLTLVLYASAAYYVHRNLMGRYLAGFYLPALGIFWSIAALVPRFGWPRSGIASLRREWGVIGIAAVVHALILRLILTRYF